MARGMPSMVALLGLLAVAGYQNRDKLGGLLDGFSKQSQDPNNPNRSSGGLDSILGGLGDLVDRFRQAGRGEKADSWVRDGENAPVDATDLEEALGEETITELTQKTGLSRTELLERLCKTLPNAVDRMTPAARIPTEAEASRFV